MQNYTNVFNYLKKMITPIEKTVNAVKEALKDYTELTKTLSYLNCAKVSLEKANLIFSGMNYDEKEGFFDVNFGTIATTVKRGQSGDLYLDRYIDVYIDEDIAFSLDTDGDFSLILQGYREDLI